VSECEIINAIEEMSKSHIECILSKIYKQGGLIGSAAGGKAIETIEEKTKARHGNDEENSEMEKRSK
jgi:hypothetical protein